MEFNSKNGKNRIILFSNSVVCTPHTYRYNVYEDQKLFRINFFSLSPYTAVSVIEKEYEDSLIKYMIIKIIIKKKEIKYKKTWLKKKN